MNEKGYDLPQVAITGGLVMEDDVYKALALGGPFIQLVGIGRGAMAAAFAGSNIERMIENNKLPKNLQAYGQTKEELFKNIRQLKEFYGQKALDIPGGAIGVYSFLDRVATGVKQFMALNRKFNLSLIDRTDIYPLTRLAEEVSGIPQLHNSIGMLLDEI
jgi:glutamate synthase domain-containing protein 2